MIALDSVAAGPAGTAVLQDISLRLAAGERVALLGASGAGKTTLLRLCGADLEPLAGTATVAGVSVHARPAQATLRRLRTRIACIHQGHDLVGPSSVARNVLAGGLGRWGLARTLATWIWPPAVELERVAAILKRVGIAHLLWQRVDRISGGERQRVAIARALYQDAPLVLADEPVSQLDPGNAHAVLDLLCRTAEEDGRTLLACLHQAELAVQYFPRAVGLRGGRIAFDLPTAQVTESLLTDLFRRAEDGR